MRRGAGYALLGAFHTMHAVASVLDNVLLDMHRGLSQKEAKFIRQRKKHYRDEAEIIRRLARRLIND